MALWFDLRTAWRMVTRQIGFTTTSLAIIALGVSFSTTLFAIVKGGLLDPWPYQGYDRIVTVRGDYPRQGRADFSLWSVPEILDLRGEPTFAFVIAGEPLNVNLTYQGRPERVAGARITPNAFAMLGRAPELGRTLTDADGQIGATPVAVVSHAFWQNRLGGDRSVVGESLQTAGAAYTIVGVMPPDFTFWDREVWFPEALDTREARVDRRYFVQAQLPQGVSLARADAALVAFAEREAAAHPEVAEYRGFRIELKSLVEGVLRSLRPILYLLVAAVVVLVLLASANLANAVLAQGLSREREFTVRRALGASGARIARPVAIECALLGASGGLAGWILARALLPWVVSLVPYGFIPAEAHIVLDGRLAWFAVAVALITSLLFALVPVVRATRVQASQALRQQGGRTGSARTHGLRSTFIVAQLSLATVVVGSAVAVALAVRSSTDRDPGFVVDDVWTARIALPSEAAAEASGARFYETVRQRLNAAPGIDRAALVSYLPVGPVPTVLAGPDESADPLLQTSVDIDALDVSPGYFDLLRIPVVRGRDVAPTDDATHPLVGVVSQSLARRFWPGRDGVGRSLTVQQGRRALHVAVIGVVGDVLTDPATSRPRPTLYQPLAQAPPVSVALGLTGRRTVNMPSTVRAAVAAVAAGVPVYQEASLRQGVLDALGPQWLAVILLALFAASAVLLSSAGVYAVVSQSVTERRREIAIRLTLGATPRQVFGAELARVARLVGLSLVVGAPAAAGALRLTASLSVAAPTSAPVALGAAVAVMAIVALASTVVPAWRASKFDLAAVG